MNYRPIPYILLQGLLFGSSIIATRFGIGQFHPLTFIGLRLLIASLLFASLYLWGGKGRFRFPKDKRLWIHASVIGIVGTAIPMWAFVSSLQYQSSGVSGTLITIAPAITVVLAHFFLPDETLTLRKIAGVLLALCGGLILVVRGESGLAGGDKANPIGYALVLVAVIMGSCRTIYTRRFVQNFNVFDVSSIRILTATLAVLPLSLMIGGVELAAVDKWGYFALGFSALAATILGLYGEIYIISEFGATTNAMTAFIVPIFASLGGALLLGELVTPGMLTGMSFIIIGVYLVNR
jgi:drug/metabolite transporter (DMT)-like permease